MITIATRGAAAGRFVGRASELSLLTAALDVASRGRAQIVLLAGEPGIGKTRTAEELADVATRRGVEVVWGRCHEDEGAPPYWSWSQALRDHLRRLGDEELRADVGDGAADLARVVPAICSRLGEVGAAGHGGSSRFALFDRVTSFLAAGAARTPLLVVLDDIHWADEGSLLLLRFVAREQLRVPLIVVATLRPAEAGARHLDLLAGFARSATRVDLAGLSAVEVAELVRDRLGAAPGPPVTARICSLTGGNPFFVGEIVRLIAHAGQSSESVLDRFAATPGARAAVRQRLAVLANAERSLLAVAAVAGEEFPLAIVGKVAGKAGHRLRAPIARLIAAGLICAQDAPGHYRFAHALVRETLYGELPLHRRARLHVELGETLETRRDVEPEARLDALAHHFTTAAADVFGPRGETSGDAPPGRSERQVLQKAIRYARLAGRQAIARHGFEEGAQRLAQALALTERLPRPPRALRADLFLARGEALARCGNKDAARTAFRSAADLARELGSWPRLARAALGLAGPWLRQLVQGEPEVVHLLEETRAAAPRDQEVVRSRVCARLAMELVAPELARRRAALVRESVTLARRSGDAAALAYALSMRHLAAQTPGQLAGRLADARRVIELARESHDLTLAAEAHGLLTRDLLEAGRVAEMREALALHARLAEQIREPQALWQVALRRVMLSLLEGRLAEAEELVRHATAVGERAQVNNPLYITTLQLLLVRREQGRLDELREQVRLYAESPVEPAIRRFWLAAIYADTGRRAEARQQLDAVAADGFAGLPVGSDRLLALCFAAETCARLDEGGHAALLYDLLAPHAGRNVIVGNAIALLDSTSRALGLLAATLARWDAAESHLREAIDSYRQMGARARLAHARYDLARVLASSERIAGREEARRLVVDGMRDATLLALPGLLRDLRALRRRLGRDLGAPATRAQPSPAVPDGREPAGTNVFLREGEYWSVAFGGPRVRIRDGKGMRQIAHLLRHPGREHLALDLALVGRDANVEGPGPRERGPDRDRRTTEDWSAEPVIDARGRRQLARHLGDLREQVLEARAFNDAARASRLGEEIEALTVQLARDVGLLGRSRRTAGAAERARVSVTRRIRETIGRIARQDPALGHFLATSIHTGRYCSYVPPPGGKLDWTL